MILLILSPFKFLFVQIEFIQVGVSLSLLFNLFERKIELKSFEIEKIYRELGSNVGSAILPKKCKRTNA